MKRKPEKPSKIPFYLELALHVYRDCAAQCCLSPSSIEADVKTLQGRTWKEGMSFLTKTLPSLGKCLDKALSRDIPLPVAHSFQLGKDGVHPQFLAGFWSIIFPRDYQEGPNSEDYKFTDWRQATHDHFNREVTSVVAVRAVRQICFLFYKLEGSHSEESEQQLIREFISTDAKLPRPGEKKELTGTTRRALESARCIIHYVLKDLCLSEIIPKHGPGSVATGEKAWEKFNFSRFYHKLDREYSYPDYFFWNYSHLADCLESLESLEEMHEATAKVVLVPKDSRGPRIISMEPLELQWIQQGQMRALVSHLEHHEITAGFVNFTNQEINRDLALQHSCPHGLFATMDMKEASDRVSVWLLEQLLPELHLRKLLASRSDNTQLPDGTLLRLNKFAPMGSATCFPIEALVFWALAVGTLIDIRCARDFNQLPSVYVYGDDIIVGKDNVDRITQVYEELALLVNAEKCCTGRFFRESCGMDAYKQCSVTPIRYRKHFSMASPPALLAYVAYHNAHRVSGHERTAKYLKGRIIHEYGQLPVCNVEGTFPLAFLHPEMSNSEVLEFNSKLFRVRFNSNLQRNELRLQVPTAPSTLKGKPDWHELQRKGTLGLSDPFGFLDAVFEPCRYTVSKRTTLRWAWVDVSQLAGR